MNEKAYPFRLWFVGEEHYQGEKGIGIGFTFEGERLMSVADMAFKMKNGSNSGLELPRDQTFSVDYDFGYYKISGTYIPPSDFKNHFPKLTEKFK